ncbi:MAG TPA: hypothetical protein VG326_14460 [Tepidisphaeraceae bacterium]|jgi:hypothetical protein|nr:hypothetical protein [Tepidisphaeraceae bacterium]
MPAVSAPNFPLDLLSVRRRDRNDTSSGHANKLTDPIRDLPALN